MSKPEKFWDGASKNYDKTEERFEYIHSKSRENTKKFLNSLWDVSSSHGDVFNPNRDYMYADRIRRREPGDETLGLSPHIDGGSFERWTDTAFQKVYQSVFNGN